MGCFTYLQKHGKPGAFCLLHLSPLPCLEPALPPISEQHQALPPQGALERNQVLRMSLLKPFTTARPEVQPPPCTMMSPALT